VTWWMRRAFKKNEAGTCRVYAICCRWLAPMRFVPFSYFCTC
jgi:hypothetical protein